MYILFLSMAYFMTLTLLFTDTIVFWGGVLIPFLRLFIFVRPTLPESFMNIAQKKWLCHSHKGTCTYQICLCNFFHDRGIIYMTLPNIFSGKLVFVRANIITFVDFFVFFRTPCTFSLWPFPKKNVSAIFKYDLVICFTTTPLFFVA